MRLKNEDVCFACVEEFLGLNRKEDSTLNQITQKWILDTYERDLNSAIDSVPKKNQSVNDYCWKISFTTVQIWKKKQCFRVGFCPYLFFFALPWFSRKPTLGNSSLHYENILMIWWRFYWFNDDYCYYFCFFVEESVVFVLMISIWIRFTYRKRGFLSITSVIMWLFKIYSIFFRLICYNWVD